MPKPRAKSKPRKKAVKKTAAKKNASRAIKLQRGGMSPEAPYRSPTRNPNPRPNRRGVPTGSRRSPPTHEQGLEMARGIADAFGLPGSRAAELRRRKQRADLPPGYQRGGSFTGPANPNVNTPPGWAWQAQRGAQQRAYDAYMRRHPKEGTQGRLGTGIGGRQLQQPPRRPPPPIRPGYQGGGELVDPTPFRPMNIPGRFHGFYPRRPNVPLPPGARRRRGRGRGGRDV